MQTQLKSGVAVAEARGYSFNSTPSLENAICRECGPKKQKTNKQTKPQYHIKQLGSNDKVKYK